ncbi:2-amino-3-carboxymuconate-6-semialdehyde decarboxylase [Klebsiella oxytoca]|nr:2-amino-3-carboxymuconate-6-semialdehyde decarboxylase [Klebsiella oxytoca]
MRGKIALEEHVSTPKNNSLWDSTGEASRNGSEYMMDVERRLLDRSYQLDEMAQRNIDHVILSLTSPGAQSILDKATAVSFARETNDYIIENYVKPNPDKFSAFATLALQNPEAAAEELERAVKKLGMKGALINGYTNVKDNEHGLYLDDESMLVFWDKVNELNVPVYLHPREPLEGPARGIYTGYESLIGSAWGFAPGNRGSCDSPDDERVVRSLSQPESGVGSLRRRPGSYAATHPTPSLSSAFRLRPGQSRKTVNALFAE